MIDILYKNKYMETLMKRSFFVLCAVCGMTTLKAQSVDDIVGKYIDAIGGKAALASVNSLVITANVNVQGNDAPSTTYILAGKGYRSEMDFGGQKMIQAVNSAGGWQIMPGADAPQPMPAEQAKLSQGQYIIGGILANYAALGYKLELIGKDTADYKLRMAVSSGSVTFYINMKTYMIDKEIINSSMRGQDVTITISFSDYRKTDSGYVLAYNTTLEAPQATLMTTIDKVTVNAPVDPKIFNMPK
jgi:hypothetical protein